MYTIGQLVKQFSISRSTLLYYDKIGLLQPSGRTEANYRLYTEKDIQRMSQIALYKEAGLPLKKIGQTLDAPESELTKALQERLQSLNEEMRHIRQQQRLILHLLGQKSLLQATTLIDKAQWIKVLKASGLNEAGMRQWHIEFERELPLAHADFLRSLGMGEDEIAIIRNYSAADSTVA